LKKVLGMKTLSQNMYQAKPDIAAYTMILSLETQQQKDRVLEAGLNYIVRPYLKKQDQKHPK
jgi:hypothetical protein